MTRSISQKSRERSARKKLKLAAENAKLQVEEDDILSSGSEGKDEDASGKGSENLEPTQSAESFIDKQ